MFSTDTFTFPPANANSAIPNIINETGQPNDIHNNVNDEHE
jgi:hypothetical protein